MDALSRLLQLAQVQVSIDVRCLLGGGFVLPHAQLQQEAAFHHVLAGQCRLQLPGRELQLQAGDFVLLPLGSEHEVHSALPIRSVALQVQQPLMKTEPALPLKTNVQEQSDASVELLCGRFRYAQGAGQLLACWLPEVLHVSLKGVAPDSDLKVLLQWLRAEAQGAPRPGAHAVIDGLGQAMLALALRAAPQSPLPAGLLPLLADARLAASIRAVLDAPGRNWTIETLASTVAMSRATYARRFQALAGCGVAEFVLRTRIMQACAWLATGQSIAGVAEAVGYGSEAAFVTAFKRVVGQTPARWRRAGSHARSVQQQG
ncbi:MAG: AraC family transcriptional regulator [Comamonas sp.]|jgi:AraC family transcriptional activator of mtrCDE|nr:AraC family transcriptional regulator [Comamonas sp.]